MEQLRRRVPINAIPIIGSLIATLASQIATLFSGVIAARTLGPEDRGHVALLTVIVSVVCGLVPLGSSSAVTYFVARNARQSRSIAKLMRLPFGCQLLLILVLQITVLFFIVGSESREIQIAGAISLLVSPAILAQDYGLRLIQGLQLFAPYNTLRVFPAAIYCIFLMLVALFGRLDIQSTMVAWAGGNVASAGLIFLVVRKALPPSQGDTSIVTRRQVLLFGAKGFLGTASPLETFRVDQLLIGLFISPAALGLYVVSLAYTSMPRVVSQSLALVALPRLAAQPQKALAQRAMWRFFSITTLLSLSMAVPLILLAGILLPFVFGEDFRGAVLPAQILVGSSVLFGGRRILSEGLRGLGYTGASALAEVASWIVLFAALASFAPKWGLVGVAWSLVTASAVGFAMVANGARQVGRKKEPKIEGRIMESSLRHE